MTPDPAACHRSLLTWFDTVRRDLPWRRERTLYGTWISEIMLQQTTVRTVVPYYQRFLARFPDVAALADATEDEVLGMWSGLGYYRRARHLHRAAREVVADHGGILPADQAGWRALPGVGDYAAGAIASMGLGERVPALDANARRVLTRWAVGDPADLAAWKPARLKRWATELVPPDRPGDWNEALMELGALLCTAATARCGECPLAGLCAAGASGRAEEIPAASRAPGAIRVRTALVVAVQGDSIALLPPGADFLLAGPAGEVPRRADFRGLHQGLWSLPATAWFEPEGPGWPRADWGNWLRAHAGTAAFEIPSESSGTLAHGITRYRITAEVFRVDIPSDSKPGSGKPGNSGRFGQESASGACFAPLEELPPVSRLVTKALETLRLTKG